MKTRTIGTFLLGLILCYSWLRPLTADELPESLLTVGTTAVDSTGSPWAFVTWKATDDSLAYGQPLAISIKNGAATSAGSFEPQGTTTLATEASIVKVQLSRAQALGVGLADLQRDINAYFDVVRNDHEAVKPGDILSPSSLSLEEKISRLITHAKSDTKTARTLQRMALAHPGLALCTGQAWAGKLSAPIGQPVTIEVRPCDPATGQIGGVVARTTINAGQPVNLLAPGRPYQVPDHKPTGNRVIKLRWPIADALRRQSPLIRGYSLYRATRAHAEAQGWQTTPPSLATLKNATTAQPQLVKKMNASAITIGKYFSDANVNNFDAETGDPITHHYVDDNGYLPPKQGPNGVNTPAVGSPHLDGTGFYYFATAIDLLGREWAVSPGGLGIACIRVAPPGPDDFTLSADTPLPTNGAAIKQKITLSWKHNAPMNDTGLATVLDNDTDSYEIYRGSNKDAVKADLANPATWIDKRIAVVPAGTTAPGATMKWTDETLPQNTDGCDTYWYAIRAVHDSPCDPDNFSDLSPPLFGSLRCYDAPAAPEGQVGFTCPLTGLFLPDLTDAVMRQKFSKYETISPSPPVDSPERKLRLKFTRRNPSIEWIEMRIYPASQTLPPDFIRYAFDGNNEELILNYQFQRNSTTQTLKIEATAGTSAGATSRLMDTELNLADHYSDWTSNKCLIIEGWADVYALSDIRFEDELDRHVFKLRKDADLQQNRLRVNNMSRIDNLCAEFSLIGTGANHGSNPDGTPVLMVSNEHTPRTIDGQEIYGNKAVFCDPTEIRNNAYRFYKPITGKIVCAHQAVGRDGKIKPIRIVLKLPQPLGEYRLFRQIDAEPMTMWAQGDGSRLPDGADRVMREDEDIPAHASTVSFFGQTFNRAGIGSPLKFIKKLNITRDNQAVPVLQRLQAIGTVADPEVQIKWQSPTTGVERFEVQMLPLGGSSPPVAGSSSPPSAGTGVLTPVVSLVPNFILSASSAIANAALTVPLLQTTKFYTAPLGASGFGSGPTFQVKQSSPLGKKYRISVRSISLSGVASAWSQAFDFEWQPPATLANTPEPKVPWPSRPLPSVGNRWPLVEARTFNAALPIQGFTNFDSIWGPWDQNEYPVGVRIARLGRIHKAGLKNRLGANHLSDLLTYHPASVSPEVSATNYRAILDIDTRYVSNYSADLGSTFDHSLYADDPHNYLIRAGESVQSQQYFRAFGEPRIVPPTVLEAGSLLPAVLYREQVANAKFPTVSGDVIQVSPMMERIAYQSPRVIYGQQKHGITIWDPYIGVVSTYQDYPPEQDRAPDYFIDLFLLDTQPVQKGAAYRYTLVRFSGATGEIEEVIPAGTVTIP